MAAAAGIVAQPPCADSGRPNPEAAPSLRLAPAILGRLRAPIALRPSTSRRRIAADVAGDRGKILIPPGFGDRRLGIASDFAARPLKVRLAGEQ